jgi:hypothetical protein
MLKYGELTRAGVVERVVEGGYLIKQCSVYNFLFISKVSTRGNENVPS